MAKLGRPQTVAGKKPGGKVSRSVAAQKAWLDVAAQMTADSKSMQDPVMRDVYLEAADLARNRAALARANAAQDLINDRTQVVERLIESHVS